ncbi:MAG: hypothetical protein H6834_18230 [Planctomycetes bacterium]|nr:hypothetical protein [Planctomycetota bacterium]
MARKPREFQPARKGGGRRRREEEAPAAAPAPAKKQKRKKERPEPAAELEILDSEEEVARGQLESAIVVTTFVGLLIGTLFAVIGLGKHYGYGPMKGMYEAPSATQERDLGLPEIDLRVSEKGN